MVTPIVETWVTDHLWKIDDIVRLLEEQESSIK